MSNGPRALNDVYKIVQFHMGKNNGKIRNCEIGNYTFLSKSNYLQGNFTQECDFCEWVKV